MDTKPFTIYYEFRNTLCSAQIRPCCKQDNVVDFAVWDEGELLFTMTRQAETGKWVIALKNADDIFADELVQLIGDQINKKIADKTD